jgi:hypothetical protein
MSSLIRKISAKTVCGKIEKPVPKKGVQLFIVGGIANKVRTGDSQYGTWTALVGQFEATNIATGEVFIAPQCFLPEPMNGMIAASLEMVDEEGKRVNNSIQFAVEVGVKFAENQIEYEYTATEIMKSDAADPLASIREHISKVLPAPAKK